MTKNWNCVKRNYKETPNAKVESRKKKNVRKELKDKRATCKRERRKELETDALLVW